MPREEGIGSPSLSCAAAPSSRVVVSTAMPPTSTTTVGGTAADRRWETLHSTSTAGSGAGADADKTCDAVPVVPAAARDGGGWASARTVGDAAALLWMEKADVAVSRSRWWNCCDDKWTLPLPPLPLPAAPAPELPRPMPLPLLLLLLLLIITVPLVVVPDSKAVAAAGSARGEEAVAAEAMPPIPPSATPSSSDLPQERC